VKPEEMDSCNVISKPIDSSEDKDRLSTSNESPTHKTDKLDLSGKSKFSKATNDDDEEDDDNDDDDNNNCRKDKRISSKDNWHKLSDYEDNYIDSSSSSSMSENSEAD